MSPCPFPATITITPRVPPLQWFICHKTKPNHPLQKLPYVTSCQISVTCKYLFSWANFGSVFGHFEKGLDGTQCNRNFILMLRIVSAILDNTGSF